MASVQLRIDDDFPNGFDDDEPVIVYPEKRRRLAFEAPRALQEQWAEACRCFGAKAYTGTVVMVRRMLEATCADQGVVKWTLYESLKELQDKELINGMLADWADALRVLGNDGAHYTGTPVNRADAEDALDFAEALVDSLYVLRLRFALYKSRRDGNGS